MNTSFLSAINNLFDGKYKYAIKIKNIIKLNEMNCENLYAELDEIIKECEAIDFEKTDNKFNCDYHSLAVYIFQILQEYINANKGKDVENVGKVEKKLRENYLVKYQINMLPFRFYEIKFIKNHHVNYESKNLVYFSRLNYYKNNKSVITCRKTIENLEQLLCILRHD